VNFDYSKYCLVGLIAAAATLNAQAWTKANVKTLNTNSGARFGWVGEKPPAPAPTLFVFASDLAGSLTSGDYVKCGQLLAKDGFLCVSLDVPCHGMDQRAGEPNGLKGWRARLDKNENFAAEFVKKASEVLDYLIREGYTDPKRVAVAGTSRGGFMALHFAAAEPRVRAAVAFAPVTDLPVLTEFKGLENHALTQSIAASTLAETLAGRPIWICIGNHDQRVGTDHCIAFTRKVVAASIAGGKPAPIEIHVVQSEGHGIHGTAHDEAAVWLAAKLKE
jgi:dienelactone hydrolase